MTFEKLSNLKSTHYTLRLLSSDNFPMTLSFFYNVFIKASKTTLQHSEILSYLDDYLFTLNQIYGDIYPREAKEYLDEFVSERNGYLRKYHGTEDEALYELTPYTQKALEFIESLEKKEFVGSRSKFNIIFELLEELEFETNLSDEQRIEELKLQKEKIDTQIEAIRNKRDIRFDDARIKEHYMQIEETVRKLKYDFSEIEYNFRTLNNSAMEKIAFSSQAKGEVLGSIFEYEDTIRQSDQGKSFFAFWQILSDDNQNTKLAQLIQNLYKIDSIRQFDKEKKLQDLQFSFLKSGEKVYNVSAKLIEQLRRFLDERIWIENRRILELCKSIEKSALEIKDDLPKTQSFTLIDSAQPKIDSIFSKSLFQPKVAQKFVKELLSNDSALDMASFYNIFFIDEELLEHNIRNVLHRRSQASLQEITGEYPITKGVAELIGYLSMAKKFPNTVLYEEHSEAIVIEDENGIFKKVQLPKIVFVREK
ncbi:MAG: DUF3375 domain-containing protein [Epsilonproteobacteria bacterium]|nr:DUF3375 domain-containing protein [Campylobacterota bacterium]